MIDSSVQIAIISGGQGIIVALIGYLGIRVSRISKNTKIVKAQVQNSHTKNFREDTDDKHDDVIIALNEIKADVREVKADVGGVKSDIGGIRSDIRNNNRRLTTLETIEMTNPRKKNEE